MYNGIIQQVALPMEVYDKPVNRFVAGFLGTPPMSFFDGRIKLKDNKASFLLTDGTSITLTDSNGKLSCYHRQGDGFRHSAGAFIFRW